MNWNNVSLVVLGLSAFAGAFLVALWISLVVWTFRDMRSRSRDAFAQLLAALMALVLGPLGALLYLLLRPRESLAEKYERSLEEEALLQDIEERQICPGCKQPIESDYLLCPICHTQLRQPCIKCERLIHPRWELCPYCGASQQPVPDAEKVGHVTLLDLEQEDQELLGFGSESLPALDLEAELEPVEELAAVPSPASGPTEDESEWLPASDEAGDQNALDDLFSTTDPTEDADTTTEGDDGDDASRRPLSLFRQT
jgi:RNA polymerase subunit RPABC4/transcription elongation factor Spt4